MISSKISIHVPSWGTTDYRHTGSKDRKNFNPRSLVGNDQILQPVLSIHLISIHVPSWGTTHLSEGIKRTIKFQSTFPRGERREKYPPRYQDQDFNPRSLVGNDGVALIFLNSSSISIHVPSWGTTEFSGIFVHHKLFQSTFPRGERRMRWRHHRPGQDFNPRSLVGNDASVEYVRALANISIHVPSWGTTDLADHFVAVMVISIHVPSWGTT